ncbi:hypothetical protein, partial [Cohnella boryungensis]
CNTLIIQQRRYCSLNVIEERYLLLVERLFQWPPFERGLLLCSVRVGGRRSDKHMYAAGAACSLRLVGLQDQLLAPLSLWFRNRLLREKRPWSQE